MNECEFAKFPTIPIYFPFAPGDTIWVIDEKPDGEWVPVQVTVVLVAASTRNRTVTTSNGMILDLVEDGWFFTEKSARVFCNTRNDWLHTKQ